MKWLGSIEVANRPAENYFVARSYKVFPPEVNSAAVDWTSQPPLYALPLNAAICNPLPLARVPAGTLLVEGWAFPPGTPGARLDTVEVSADGGSTWIPAGFSSPEVPYCWRLWRAEIPISIGTREILARATDTTGHAQPEHAPWNFKGYLHNSWHRVPVEVEA